DITAVEQAYVARLGRALGFPPTVASNAKPVARRSSNRTRRVSLRLILRSSLARMRLIGLARSSQVFKTVVRRSSIRNRSGLNKTIRSLGYSSHCKQRSFHFSPPNFSLKFNPPPPSPAPSPPSNTPPPSPSPSANPTVSPPRHCAEISLSFFQKLTASPAR